MRGQWGAGVSEAFRVVAVFDHPYRDGLCTETYGPYASVGGARSVASRVRRRAHAVRESVVVERLVGSWEPVG